MGDCSDRSNGISAISSPPYLIDDGKTVETPAALTGIALLPDHLLMVVSTERRGENANIFHLDIFDAESTEFLGTFQSDELNILLVRFVRTDAHGNIHFDQEEPTPHIDKYAVVIHRRVNA